MTASLTKKIRASAVRLSKQTGLTLVELLVALVISSVVVIAAMAALAASRQGFAAVDAASQLRDNARFAAEMLQRFGVQAAFYDVADATTNVAKNAAGNPVDNPKPSVFGFNNATAHGSEPLTKSTAWSSTTALGYGSDVLILRYQVAERYPKSGKSDLSMIDCFGNPNGDGDLPSDPGKRESNILYVGVDTYGEPGLRCKTSKSPGDSEALVTGVENFQVLYGVDGVTANTETTAAKKDVATNYLRADQMAVPGDTTGEKTNANWRRVRNIRIGMVIRGPLGSAPTAVSRKYYPLGGAADSDSGTTGSAMSSTADAGTAFTPPADTRLRQVVTFTIHLRNEQGF